MLNVNCISIYSIILSVTCHGLINFPSLIQIPSLHFVEHFATHFTEHFVEHFEVQVLWHVSRYKFHSTIFMAQVLRYKLQDRIFLPVQDLVTK